MQLSEYQKTCLNTWGGEQKLIRAFLGVAGEAGELSENIKKHLRGDYDLEELKKRSFKELGDTLYYLAVVAHELGLDLDDIAEYNIQKLAKRHAEGKIKGDGEHR
ncbi:MAG: nucleoside triphosphate pyrophosphohydrolase family protein [Candidatus Omnitrophica bacterium]|nr:nucleoside triphosphate pyrophosphohydrolase family protein [Candidatus Omnitrophota bacterium]